MHRSTQPPLVLILGQLEKSKEAKTPENILNQTTENGSEKDLDDGSDVGLS
jgi:hypothetical protein